MWKQQKIKLICFSGFGKKIVWLSWDKFNFYILISGEHWGADAFSSLFILDVAT